MVQSLKENKTLKNALDAMKNTPIPVAVRMVDTGIGVRLPYIESSTVGEVAGKFSKASTAAKDDAYQLAKGSGGVKGMGNLKFKEGYYVEHTTGPVEKFTERNGISGGHNYDEFENYFNSNSNKYELGPVVKKEHPDIDGIFDIEYKVKYEKWIIQGKMGPVNTK
ncbi:hypothetical protein BCJMU51_3173 [Bacillus cereus]|nr:hypothetical protein BCM0045_3170 [Bacillus cereus]BCC01117.1 hypothetical protein BCM0057_3199 [Bacillus cereus]BCC24623.1 hypothetical protein BCM0079_3216 [Bacillus cereus]BCC36203.1 hypothetical protein BCM0105_3193 [Bacillus cereus]BCC41979.1 hypothetical protein BCJMU01_3146 [Bacillus cereus]